MTSLADDEEFTELVDADFPRVDLVGKGANGIPRFLIAKSDGSGLLEPGFVRDLIAKGEPEPSGRERVTMPNGITISGSPADIAKLMHEGALRYATPGEVAKAEMSAKSQNDLPDSDFAYIEPGGKKDADGKTTPRSLRHFNISDAAHVRHALARASSSPFGDKALPRIHSAARKFGIEVSKEAGVAGVTKADMGPELDDGVDQLDPTVPLCAPEEDAPGDPAVPASPAWEAIDAATAAKWCSILSRARVAIDLLAEREMLEAASADPDDAENAWDLQDACCAIDYAISVLAPFAVAEQSAADCGEADLMAAIGKAAGALESVPLGTVEGLCAVAKSGRVLSAANEAHIREAAARLNTVLSSLPQAPTADDGQPVAKMTPAEEASMPEAMPSEDVTAASGQQPAMGTAEPAPVAKQDGQDAPAGLALVYDRGRRLIGVTNAESILQRVAKADASEGKVTMQAVFDESGNLVGIVDPADITPVAGAGGKSGDAPADAADGGGDGTAAPDGASADAADMTPQPPAEAGTPADDVAKATQDTEAYAVLESIVTKALAAALDGRAPAEDIAKSADVAGLADEVRKMQARLATVEEQPAAPKVFTNGQVPPAHQMRGQDQGAPQVDVAKARARKAELMAADAPDQARIAKEMQQDAVDVLAAMHAARR